MDDTSWNFLAKTSDHREGKRWKNTFCDTREKWTADSMNTLNAKYKVVLREQTRNERINNDQTQLFVYRAIFRNGKKICAYQITSVKLSNDCQVGQINKQFTEWWKLSHNSCEIFRIFIFRDGQGHVSWFFAVSKYNFLRVQSHTNELKIFQICSSALFYYLEILNNLFKSKRSHVIFCNFIANSTKVV